MDAFRYLQKMSGPGRTKRYVLMLQRSSLVPEQELQLIQKASEHALPKHSVIRLEDPSEGLKVLNVKNIEVIVIHHSLLATEEQLVEYAKQLKERKKLTVLFVTKSEQQLIKAYQEKMSLYQEMDDFVLSPPDAADLFKKLQRSGSVEARAAKRFSMDVSVKIVRVDSLQTVPAILNDLSLVGCGLSFDPATEFHRGEQLRVKIPLFEHGIFHPQYGDFLNLSLRVRRLSIRGQSIGCSIEHLTPLQHECLVSLLEVMLRKMRIAKLTGKEKGGELANAK
jgi:hypothetical protein